MSARRLHLRGPIVVVALQTALSGCSSFQQASRLDADTLKAIENAPAATPSAFETSPQPYLLGPTLDFAPPAPESLNRDVTLVIAGAVPLRDIAGRIAGMTGIPVLLDISAGGAAGGRTAASTSSPGSVAGIPPPPAAFLNAVQGERAEGADRGISVHYHGRLFGLLDYVAAKADMSWKYSDGAIHLFDVETKVFEIPALAWKVGGGSKIIASAGASGEAGGSSGSSGGGGSGSSGSGGTATGSTEIDNTTVSDTWLNLQKVAETAIDGGKVFADPSLGVLTVTGTPAQIRRATDLVDRLTASLRRQVGLEMHVYTIQLSNEQNYGFSPRLAFKALNGQYGINVSGPSVPVVQSNNSPLTFGASILSGAFNGSGGVAQALATMGSITENYEQTGVTLNGQPVPIQVGKQIGYLASTSSTQTANVGSTTSLTPGFVTTGFTGELLPRVNEGKILLGVNLTISSLVSLTTVTSGGSSIQVPTTGITAFQQSAALRSGEALLLTGFKNDSGNTTRNGVFSPLFDLFGGGGDAAVGRQLIAIVITARML